MKFIENRDVEIINCNYPGLLEKKSQIQENNKKRKAKNKKIDRNKVFKAILYSVITAALLYVVITFLYNTVLIGMENNQFFLDHKEIEAWWVKIAICVTIGIAGITICKMSTASMCAKMDKKKAPIEEIDEDMLFAAITEDRIMGNLRFSKYTEIPYVGQPLVFSFDAINKEETECYSFTSLNDKWKIALLPGMFKTIIDVGNKMIYRSYTKIDDPSTPEAAYVYEKVQRRILEEKLTSDADKAKAEKQQIETEVAKLKKENDILEDAVKQSETRIARATADKISIQKALDNATAMILMHNKEADAIKSEAAEKVKVAETNLAVAETRLIEVTKAKETLTESNLQKETEIRALFTENSSVKAQLASAKEEFEKQKQKEALVKEEAIKSYEGEIKNENKTLSKQNQTLATENEALQKEREILKTKIDEITQNRKQMESDYALAQKRAEEAQGLDKNNKVLSEENGKLKSYIAEAEKLSAKRDEQTKAYHEEANRLRAENSALNEQLLILSGQKGNAEKELKELRENNSGYGTKIQELNNVIEAKNKVINDSELQLAKANDEIGRMKTQTESANTNSVKLNERINELQLQLADVDAKYAEDIKKIQDERDLAKEDLLKAQHTAKMDFERNQNFKDRIKELTTEATQQRATINAYEAKEKEWFTERTVIREQLTKLQEERKQNNDRTAAAMEKANVARRSVDIANNTIHDLEEKNEQLDKRTQALVAEKEEIEARLILEKENVSAAIKDVEAARATTKEYRAKISSLQQGNSDLKRNNSEMKSVIESLKTQQKESQEVIETLQQEKLACAREKQEAAEEAAIFEAEWNNIKRECAAKDERYKELERRAQESAQQMEDKCQKIESEHKALNENCKKSSDELVAAQKQIYDLQETISSLETKLKYAHKENESKLGTIVPKETEETKRKRQEEEDFLLLVQQRENKIKKAREDARRAASENT